MLKRKSMLGKGNRPRRPIVPLPIPASAVKHRLGSGLFSREGLKQHIAKQNERPIIFTPASNSTPEDNSQIRELRNAVNSNAGIKRSLFPRSKENVGPTYHFGSVQGITASCSKSISSQKTPGSYVTKIADPPQLLRSGSSKMPKTFVDKVDDLEDFDVHQTRAKFSKMIKPITSSSKTVNSPPYIPLLLQSTSLRKFTCMTNRNTPRVAKMPQGEEKQHIASIVVARTLFNNNSDPSISRISRAPPVIYNSSNKDSDKISHGRIEEYENSLENKYLAGENIIRAFPKRGKTGVNDRLSNISERSETLGNQLEFKSKIDKPNVPIHCSLDYIHRQNSGCLDLEQSPTHLRYLNLKPSTSIVKSTSKLPRFVKREGNLEKKDKNDSDILGNRTTLTVKQISTKDSLSKMKSDDVNKSPSESMIMTRSKRKKSLETSVTLHSDKRFCSTDSGTLKKNEIEKAEISESGYSSGALFCSSKEAQTRNKSYSYTDYPLEEYSFASKTCPDNLQISCRNISNTKATQTSPFRVSTEDRSILETGAASSAIATNNNDSVHVKELLLRLKKKLFDEINSQIDGIISRIMVGATELQNSDFSNEKNENSAKRTPTRRSQRIAARMSNSLAFVSPGTLSIDECNAKSCPSNSELNKSLHMYKELKTDFTFLRTPNASNKKRPMKSPGTFLSDKVQDQLKLLFD